MLKVQVILTNNKKKTQPKLNETFNTKVTLQSGVFFCSNCYEIQCSEEADQDWVIHRQGNLMKMSGHGWINTH